MGDGKNKGIISPTNNMKITTQRDLIRAVAKRWRQQYEPFTHDSPLFSVRNGHRKAIPKKEIAEILDAIDGESAMTPAQLARPYLPPAAS
jgi:hypothetical protein